MKSGDSIILKVPGSENRFGVYYEDLTFDNMCRVYLTEFEKKNKRKQYKEPHWYLGHREDVEKEGEDVSKN